MRLRYSRTYRWTASIGARHRPEFLITGRRTPWGALGGVWLMWAKTRKERRP